MNILDIRKQFPILDTIVKNKPLIYLDNAASTQKPLQVINKISEYYSTTNSNIHRGAHFLATKATEEYENARIKIANFIGAESHLINFTRGTTESINLLMQCYAAEHLKKGDVVLLTPSEHHANIVPWLYLKDKLGIEIRYVPFLPDFTIDISKLNQFIDSSVKLVSLAYVSNALGTIHPIDPIIKAAKSKGALVHLDLAQAIAHMPINVQSLEIDFCSFSGHKMYGPTGIGVFWAKEEHLLRMRPHLFGGEMIEEVFFDRFTVNKLPFKFEAGTPNIADVIALGAAVDWILGIGWKAIQNYESMLYQKLKSEIAKIPNHILYSPKESIGAVSFGIEGIHPFDIGQLLDSQAIAIRTGHHCCQPLMRHIGIEGTARASLAIYNTEEEVEQFGVALQKIYKLLS